MVGALLLAYVVLAFGAWCPVRWEPRGDLSSEVVLDPWPIQQVLVLRGGQRFSTIVFIAAAVGLVLPLAWLPGRFVQGPDLRLVRRRSVVAAGASPAPSGVRDPGRWHLPRPPVIQNGRAPSRAPEGETCRVSPWVWALHPEHHLNSVASPGGDVTTRRRGPFHLLGGEGVWRRRDTGLSVFAQGQRLRTVQVRVSPATCFLCASVDLRQPRRKQPSALSTSVNTTAIPAREEGL